MEKVKEPSERDNLDLLNLVCELHHRALLHPSEQMHNNYMEVKAEMESRLAPPPSSGEIKSAEEVTLLAQGLAETRRNIHAYSEEYCEGVVDGFEEGYKAASQFTGGGGCQPGCKAYSGGEIRHRKDCQHYPESFSEMYDNLLAKQPTPNKGVVEFETPTPTREANKEAIDILLKQKRVVCKNEDGDELSAVLFLDCVNAMIEHGSVQLRKRPQVKVLVEEMIKHVNSLDKPDNELFQKNKILIQECFFNAIRITETHLPKKVTKEEVEQFLTESGVFNTFKTIEISRQKFLDMLFEFSTRKNAQSDN